MKIIDEMPLCLSQEWTVARHIKVVRDAIGYGAVEQKLIAYNHQPDAQGIHGIGDAEAMRAMIIVHSSEFESGIFIDQGCIAA